jgi:hypothetical protein
VCQSAQRSDGLVDQHCEISVSVRQSSVSHATAWIGWNISCLPIDLDAPGLHKLDDSQSALVLRLAILEVIVVVEEFCSWVCGCGGAEGNRDVLLADYA